MRRDIILGSLGVIVTSYFIFRNFFISSAAYRHFEISPLLYKPNIIPIDTTKIIQMKVHSEPVGEPRTHEPKYIVSNDLTNHEDQYNIETYMELPLETDGKTMDIDTLFQDINEKPIEDPTFIKYIRFQCTSVRGAEKGEVRIGGFKFLQGGLIASSKPIYTWNPHNGKTENYAGGTWSDSDQKMVIFRFSEPVLITRFELKSSADSIDFDPIHWKIDGSMSGTYWIPFDDRTDSETAFPKERLKTVTYLMNKI